MRNTLALTCDKMVVVPLMVGAPLRDNSWQVDHTRSVIWCQWEISKVTACCCSNSHVSICYTTNGTSGVWVYGRGDVVCRPRSNSSLPPKYRQTGDEHCCNIAARCDFIVKSLLRFRKFIVNASERSSSSSTLIWPCRMPSLQHQWNKFLV